MYAKNFSSKSTAGSDFAKGNYFEVLSSWLYYRAY